MRSQTLGFGIASFVAGLALGAGAVLLVAPRTPGAAPGAAPAPGATPAPLSAAAAPAEPSAAGPSVASTSASPAPAHSPSPAGPGEGVITGKVTGPGGEPLAGVLVRATAADDGFEFDPDPQAVLDTGAPPPHEDVEELVRRYRAMLLRAKAGLQEATTDSTGAYALSGLTSKSYRLEAWLEGYRMQREGSDPWGVVPAGGSCDFKATRLGTVRVSVLLPDGTPAKRATISWSSTEAGGFGGSSFWTPASPVVSVDHGSFEFTAAASLLDEDEPGISSHTAWSGMPHRFRFRDHDRDSSPFESEPQTVTVGTGEPPVLVFRLQGKPGIRVKVSFASTERPRCYRIAAMPLEEAAGAGNARLLRDDGVSSAWLTDEPEGLLVGLEPGNYLVGVTFRGGVVGPTATTSVGNDLASVELRVPAGEIRDWVKVWVRAPDGSAVTDAEIDSGCRGSEGSGSSGSGTQAQADGSYRVEHFEKDAPSSSWSFSGDELGDGPRTYYIEATSERYGKAETIYDPARDREVTVAFAAPAKLKVTIAGYAQSPNRDRVLVSLMGADGESQESVDLEGELDRSGSASFRPVVPGRYEVVLHLMPVEKGRGRHRSRWNANEVARVPVTLGAGESSISVPLSPVTDLVVSFEGDAPALEFVGPDGRPSERRHNSRSDGSRSITFPDLAPGRYRLVTEAGDMWLDVPASSTVAFRAAPFNAYHIEIRGKGYLHEMGLRTGDLVVAIDGAEFKDRLAMDAALAMAKTRETTTFTIQRDGQRFDLSGDARRFEGDELSWYRPWTR